ncbi:MAG: MaoC/PaaZ C-terminal domain-containing protein, partial [Thermodesulfobacteriota bacterium]
PVRPADKLTIRGSLAAISPHKAGTLAVIRYQALDEHGEPVFTEHIGGLMRGVDCSGPATTVEPLPAAPSHPGSDQPLWDAPIFINQLAPFVYDGCTNIYFPIHTSVAFARGVGLPGIILQGTATLAYAVREIINREADGDPHALRQVGCRFTGMVMPGSEIRVALSARSSDATGTGLFFHVSNAAGSLVISNGYARLERGDR